MDGLEIIQYTNGRGKNFASVLSVAAVIEKNESIFTPE